MSEWVKFYLKFLIFEWIYEIKIHIIQIHIFASRPSNRHKSEFKMEFLPRFSIWRPSTDEQEDHSSSQNVYHGFMQASNLRGGTTL